VLVVDDQPDSLEFFRIALEQNGAQVITVSSVREAVKAIEASPPNVLVSDIGLPGEDGYSLIACVRDWEAERGRSLPALVLSAYAREEDRQRALDAGFQIHLSKPVEPDDLVAVVVKLAHLASTR
jgi:hypothetical protein